MKRVAVLLTCFNRKEKTVRCLNSLFESLLPVDVQLNVYLVDDGSTDGTATFIEEKYPFVKIIKGNGELYWNRGMHLAWKVASKSQFDYYLWLNDDVVLYNSALEEMFDCYKISNGNVIVSGVIETKDKKKVLYGGYDENKEKIVPHGQMRKITFLNGNFVLVPMSVFEVLGNLDSHFHHDLGDVDYGFRARKKHLQVLTSRLPVGYGEPNEYCRERLNNSNLVQRFKKLYSPLGANPSLIFYYRKKHFNIIHACFYYVFLHVLNIIPDVLNEKLFKDRYQ